MQMAQKKSPPRNLSDTFDDLNVFCVYCLTLFRLFAETLEYGSICLFLDLRNRE